MLTMCFKRIALAILALMIVLMAAPFCGPVWGQQEIILEGEVDAPTTAQHAEDIDALLAEIAELEAALTEAIAETDDRHRTLIVGVITRLNEHRARLEALEEIVGSEPPEPDPDPDPDPPDPKPPLNLVESGPVVVTEDGALIEGLRITSTAGVALTLNNRSDVIVRNVEILHEGGKGVEIFDAPRATLENVNIFHTGARERGVNPVPQEQANTLLNLHCSNSPDLTLTRVRLGRGSSGAYLQRCNRSRFSWIEGYDFRGPFPRGQMIQWNASDDALLEDFSIINPLETSWPEDNLNAFGSNNVTIRRGLIDGNNAPSGVGVLFEVDGAGNGADYVIEDVDAVRMGNGAFGLSRVRDVVMRNVRARDNHCEGVGGRGAPRSGAQNWIVWPGPDPANKAIWNVEIQGQFWRPCSYGHIVWDKSAVNVWDVVEEEFTPRAPIELVFPWERSD